MNFRDWSSVLGTWVSISGAVLGGYLALQAYNKDIEVRRQDIETRANSRVAQTFEFFERFHSSEMLRTRAEITRKLEAGAGPDALASPEVSAFVDFFDAVEICVERRLCDKELSHDLFSPYARTYLGTALFDYIREVRRGYEARPVKDVRPYGQGIEKFAYAAVVGSSELQSESKGQ